MTGWQAVLLVAVLTWPGACLFLAPAAPAQPFLELGPVTSLRKWSRLKLTTGLVLGFFFFFMWLYLTYIISLGNRCVRRQEDCLSKYPSDRSTWEIHLDCGSPGKVQYEQLQLFHNVQFYRNNIDFVYKYLWDLGLLYEIGQHLIVVMEGFYLKVTLLFNYFLVKLLIFICIHLRYFLKLVADTAFRLPDIMYLV